MKTNSKWVINLVSSLLTAAWYINIVLIIIGFSVLTLAFATKDYTDINIPVKLKGDHTSIALQSLAPTAKLIIAETDGAIIKIQAKVTAGIVFTAYTFFVLVEVLIMMILYHLRKIFTVLKTEQPFQMDNVRRLRIVALCLVLSTPLHIVWGIANYLTLTANVKDFSARFMMIWEDNLMGIILGVVLYIVADILRHGITLKQENEAFV